MALPDIWAHKQAGRRLFEKSDEVPLKEIASRS